MKPLDFVSPKNSQRVGIVTEVSSFRSGEKEIFQASVSWIGKKDLKTAWWQETELDIVDNLPILLASRLAHPFGNGKEYVERLMK